MLGQSKEPRCTEATDFELQVDDSWHYEENLDVKKRDKERRLQPFVMVKGQRNRAKLPI
jgi:hypothetical protein